MNSDVIYKQGLEIHKIEPDHSEESETSVTLLKFTLLSSG